MVKKCNAWAGLAVVVLLVAHIAFTAYSYLTLTYDPGTTKALGYALAGVVGVHALLGAFIVFHDHDQGKRKMYRRLNWGTVVQRSTAIAMVVLFAIHIRTGNLVFHHEGFGGELLAFLVTVELLFFAAVLTHVATSFSRALVMLGILQSREAQKTIDRIAWAICGLVFVAMATIIVPTQIAMFGV